MDLDVFIAMLSTLVGGEPPPMFWVNDGGTYTDMAVQAGLTRSVNSWGCAAGDLNGDGFLDIYEVENNDFGTRDTLWLNNGNSNHWIIIDPEGVISNRDAIGLKVWLTAGGVTQVQELYSTTTHPLRLHFGLGSHTVVDEVILRWPSGLLESYEDVAADQVFQPREGGAFSWTGQGVHYR
jgi:ASPIC and UnbV/FG-GAP-like repeat